MRTRRLPALALSLWWASAWLAAQIPHVTPPGDTVGSALVVGLSKYQRSRPLLPSLIYGRQAAQALSQRLASDTGGTDSREIRLLTDEKATASAIDSELRGLLRKPGAAGAILFYFSGYASYDPKRGLLLLPYDVDPRPEHRVESSLPLKDLEELVSFQTRGPQLVVLMDVTLLGRPAPTNPASPQGSEPGQWVPSLLGKSADANRERMPLLAGIRKLPDLEGDEGPSDDHGLFTYYLLEGLNGQADRSPAGNADRKVTLQEVFRYLQLVYKGGKGRQGLWTNARPGPKVTLGLVPETPGGGGSGRDGPSVISFPEREAEPIGASSAWRLQALLRRNHGASGAIPKRSPSPSAEKEVETAVGRRTIPTETNQEKRAPTRPRDQAPAEPHRLRTTQKEPPRQIAAATGTAQPSTPATPPLLTRENPKETPPESGEPKRKEPPASPEPQGKDEDEPLSAGDLEPSLQDLVAVPSRRKDAQGNRIRRGADPQTGLPLEVETRIGGVLMVLVTNINVVGQEALGTNAFYLGKYEVTNLQLESSRPFHKDARAAKYKATLVSDQDDTPAVLIAPHEAEGFCRWLSGKYKRSFRLPSASEWREVYQKDGGELKSRKAEEWVAAGNFADQTAGIFFHLSWASRFSDGYPTTSRVGKYRAKTPGLYDLDGNVAEWCRTEDVSSANLKTSSYLYLGGSWFSRPGGTRRPEHAGGISKTIGFRVALPIPKRH